MATENNTEIPCTLFTLIYRIDLHVKSLSPFNLRDMGRGNNIFKLLVAAGLRGFTRKTSIHMMLLFVLGVSVLAVVTAYSPEEWKDIIDRVNE